MSEISARRATPELFPELFDGLRKLEGRFPTNEIAARIVNAAMAQPGVAGARLWRIDKGVGEVWAQAGTVPAPVVGGLAATSLHDGGADATLWTGALGSDDFRVRVLEVRGTAPLTDACEFPHHTRTSTKRAQALLSDYFGNDDNMLSSRQAFF